MSAADSMPTFGTPPPLSAYELDRLEQIARNEAKLSELGLLSSKPLRCAPSRQSAPKRPRPPPTPKEPAAPVRRSARALAIEGAERERRERHAEATLTRGTAGSPVALVAQPRLRGEPSAAGLEPAEQAQLDASAGSSRSEAADLEALARLGVGNEVPGPATKASVMELASRGRCPKFSKCVPPYQARVRPPSYVHPSETWRSSPRLFLSRAASHACRYSGSIEWTNAIFLFVNVGGSDYSNLFSHNGRRMSWFAGGRQDKTTPVIRRLLGSNAPPRLLFCRRQGQGGASPYVYCGRLEYVQHYPDSHPLEVEWALADSDALGKSTLFQAMLAEAPHAATAG